jgi:tetratricopeptide (TPR) repeat protein
MKVRCVSFALVSAACLAAFATTCGTALASSDEANSALVRKAYATLQSGDAKTAVGEYSDAIASEMLDPEMLANALLNRALAQQQLQDNAAALSDYDAAIALNVMAPSLRSTALYNRGLANQKLGNTTKAVEDFTASLLINPEFAQAYYSRANVLRDSGQLLFALSDYERALRFNHPDKAKVHYGFATAYLALKRPLDAKREFNSALEINPDYGQARAQLVLLGDQTAQAQTAIDPVMTGSVGAYTGGTSAIKPGLPAPVEVPAILQASLGKKQPKSVPDNPKKIDDRVPEQTAPLDAVVEDATSNGEEVVAIEAVPPIPEPLTAKANEPVIEAKVADVTEEAPQAMSGWVVQIASADTESSAWSTWKKMQGRFKVLKSSSPNVVKADLGAKGIFYRVRLGGFDQQASAKQACAKLKAGGVSCYISRVGS